MDSLKFMNVRSIINSKSANVIIVLLNLSMEYVRTEYIHTYSVLHLETCNPCLMSSLPHGVTTSGGRCFMGPSGATGAGFWVGRYGGARPGRKAPDPASGWASRGRQSGLKAMFWNRLDGIMGKYISCDSAARIY